jgi:hypothetical protein
MELVEYKINTGEFAEIKRGILSSNLPILYSGMPNDDTFALSPVTKQSFFMEGFKFSTTIYYRKDRKEIRVLDDDFRVVEVTPDYIVLNYVKY